MELAAVTSVCREHPRIHALNHVVECLDQLLDYSHRWTIPKAAQRGHFFLVVRLWARNSTSKKAKLLNKAMVKAAKYGHLDIMQWIHHSVFQPSGCELHGVLSKAVAAGHVDVADWIDIHYSDDQCEPMAIVRATRDGNLDMIQWVVRRRPMEWLVVVAFFDPLMEAATHGHLPVVQWLWRWTKAARRSDLEQTAAEYGHVHVAQWLALESAKSRAADTVLLPRIGSSQRTTAPTGGRMRVA